MPNVFIHKYEDIISLDNLLLAWQEFLSGKRKKQDVQEFSLHLMDNIIALHNDLKNNIYQHGGYEDFYINDPKRRHIYKATVRDRLLHHAVYRLLYPFFDKTFIADSFSCRKDKGLHKGLGRFRAVSFKAGQNNTKTCYVLKCDIKQFFASIDHGILLKILEQSILDKNVLNLLCSIINSYSTIPHVKTGLPLGNLTSQIFANIYLNKLDQFIKHKLKIKHYLRYADDFVIFSTSKLYLQNLLPSIQSFLTSQLSLTLHPNKICLKTLASGVDWLGWTIFPHHRILRTKTKRRMFNRLVTHPTNETLQSYLGMLGWGNGWKISKEIEDLF